MDVPKSSFEQRVSSALHNPSLKTAVLRGTDRLLNGRNAAFSELTDQSLVRAQARAVRQRSLAQLPDLLEQLERNVVAQGGHVFWAANADEANRYICDLARHHNVHRVIKSKSMTTEEIGVNPALQKLGVDVIETDLGEYIMQLAGERPAHVIAPAIQKSRDDIARLFARYLGTAPDASPAALTLAARRKMRQIFISASMGITGANFAVAETGTIAIVSNEGNARYCTSLPPIHVAVMGIEKVLATLEDLMLMLQVLPRSATGQRMSSYVSMTTGPRRPSESDSPGEFHLVLLDNGRSATLATEYAESLLCIRCGACSNACPVYRQIGGQAYGSVYSGPIGAVLTPVFLAPDTVSELPGASSLCGACQAVCPVNIDIPGMLLRLRSDGVERGRAHWYEALGMRLYRWVSLSGGRFRLAGQLARWSLMPFSSGGVIHSLPPPLQGWTHSRDFPQFAAKSFRQRWAQRRGR